MVLNKFKLSSSLNQMLNTITTKKTSKIFKKNKKEEKLKKEEVKKEKAILKIFKEKYQKLFNGEELSLENISKTHFTDEEIKVGLKEYEKKQLLLEKEAKERKEKERIKELKKLRRRIDT
ncbi:MAG: hypothetical protein FWH29_10250 [Methanobrevibacter sp.]|nr:hypothetical protein [Methanobrevibacter sp.]